jgi:methylenetetrahydrofolate--tRNA-(uracil-5-)-methyltransferase
LGSLLGYVTDENRTNFQPINANYGLFPPLPGRTRKGRERRLKQAERALAEMEPFSAHATADVAEAVPG